MTGNGSTDIPAVQTVKRRYLARQPIYDRGGGVVAYEILYRSGSVNSYDGVDPDLATSQVLVSTLLTFGLDRLTSGRTAFINATRASVSSEYIGVLPRDKVVIEVLEQIEPDRFFLEDCRRLKQQGYRLALDDVVFDGRMSELMKLADIVKVDFRLTNPKGRVENIEKYSRPGLVFLAEKIETKAEYEEALAHGYELFQGYYFSKPEIVSRSDLSGLKVNVLDLLRAVHRPVLDFRELEMILKQDVGLSYKLLRYINSAFFSPTQPISSLRHALAYLGEVEIRKWVTLLTLARMSEHLPDETFITAVIRARFCEKIAQLARDEGSAPGSFLVGMFSLIDTLLGRPLPEILDEIGVSNEIKATLLGRNTPYSSYFAFTRAYEEGDFDALVRLGTQLRIPEEEAVAAYLESVAWGEDIRRNLER
ncbi:MAG: HDOD domain-containing protein [Candidatus Hydrogenedentota bacterium]|nr:MAG: HDOD domain-containing protein [Candidatus Hydrogenedentota bacterium]